MKQANNNEVDLLLRSLARERDERSMQVASMSVDGKRTVSEHLDADELNSCAEGVVPAPARTRYIEHLADCEQCRSIVIGLTQAAGAVTRYESLEQQRGLSFWQKLAALFSPAVLRYAVPALALAGIVGISLLVLRQQRNQDLAQNEPAATSTSSDRLKQTESLAGKSPSERRPEVQKTLEPGTTADASKPKNNLQDDETVVAQAPGGDSNFAAAPKVKDATPSGQESGEMQTKPVYGLEPKVPAPPPPSTALSEADKSSGIAKEQPAKREDRDEQERRQDLYVNVPSDEHGPNRSAAPRSAAPQGGRQAEGVMTTRGASAADKKEKAGEAEATTTVAGRHFRSEGNAWVDTAYDSSRATIKVTRGSEQYRALVADEPGLRTIADQLRGVVIVVWKNRAYRIQ